MQKWNIHTIAQFSSIVAGLHCTKYGNSTAIPAKEELEKSLKKYRFDAKNTDNIGAREIHLDDPILTTLLIPKPR